MNLPPIDIDHLNIVELPLQKRQPLEEGAFLQPVPYEKCRHFRGPFEVDVDAGKCRCKQCGEEVSPIFVLEQLMKTESMWMRTRRDYQDEMKRLAQRSSTKCQHCGQMTGISRR
ncbi:hypothetical protein J7E70_02140 [Variovorax paradoxus]|nr:hypothetical protein [Variovorax paradoxus]MBT2299254.1 hypothetical protein [Variovorax paradoxus]